MPSATTVMTKNHHILFQDQLVPAYRFINLSNKIKKVKYSGEVLYNVLLANHATMMVNNLVCETLHPENRIAKLYTGEENPAHQEKPVHVINSLQHKNLGKYKSIVHRLY
jgi:hypothetical protein